MSKKSNQEAKNGTPESQKSGKGKFVAGGACGVAAAAALLAYFGGIIPGFGQSESGGNTKQPETTAAVTSMQTETTAETTAVTTAETTEMTTDTFLITTTVTTEKQTAFIDITVSGNGYTFENRTYTADQLDTVTAALESAVKAAGTDAVIRITDQEASLNAYKALTEKLKELTLRIEESQS
ncbi:MAG: hypothetical protein IK130_07125 [Oscillospiraceae bacterium]|nr:hypothetical protein [Oscillospiraceae bacterium]